MESQESNFDDTASQKQSSHAGESVEGIEVYWRPKAFRVGTRLWFGLRKWRFFEPQLCDVVTKFFITALTIPRLIGTGNRTLLFERGSQLGRPTLRMSSWKRGSERIGSKFGIRRKWSLSTFGLLVSTMSCRDATPDKIQREHGKQGLQIIGVTYSRERKARVRRFARSLKVNYPILLGTREIKACFSSEETLPLTVVINHDVKGSDIISGILLREEFDEKTKPRLMKNMEGEMRNAKSDH